MSLRKQKRQAERKLTPEQRVIQTLCKDLDSVDKTVLALVAKQYREENGL